MTRPATKPAAGVKAGDAASGRNGRLIAVANMKGGVGKTTTVVSLAEALAADDRHCAVLVVDLDPQASASLCLAGDDLLAQMITDERTLQDFIEKHLDGASKVSLDGFIRSNYSFTTHQERQLDISLLPCGPRLRSFEKEMLVRLTAEGRSIHDVETGLFELFKRHLKLLRTVYDYVIFDCPPGISPIAEVSIRSSDVVLVPTIPDEISNFGLNAFCNELWGQGPYRNRSLPTPPMPFVLPTRVQQGLRQHQAMLERFEKEAKEPDPAYRVMATRVAQSAGLSTALTNNGHVTFQRKYTSAVIDVLERLVGEVKGICHAAQG